LKAAEEGGRDVGVFAERFVSTTIKTVIRDQ
jgi:hypothetical protein